MQGVLEGVLVVPTVLVTVLLFGALIRRLLAVRLGPVRTALAALLALLLAGPLLRAFLPEPERADPATALLFAALALCSASLAAMAVVVIAERWW